MSRLRLSLVTLSTLLAFIPTAAFAQGVKGEGTAVNSTGHHGHFRMMVTRGPSTVLPHFSFEMPSSTSNTPSLVIKMTMLTDLTVTGHTAEFKGHATMTRMANGGPVTVRGVVIVKAADNRNPTNPSNAPDAITVRFMSPTNTGPAFSFTGLVHRGDIVVWN